MRLYFRAASTQRRPSTMLWLSGFSPSHHFAAKIRTNSYSTFSKIGSFIGTAGSYKGRTL
jgi:hypothetical protein